VIFFSACDFTPLGCLHDLAARFGPSRQDCLATTWVRDLAARFGAFFDKINLPYDHLGSRSCGPFWCLIDKIRLAATTWVRDLAARFGAFFDKIKPTFNHHCKRFVKKLNFEF